MDVCTKYGGGGGGGNGLILRQKKKIFEKFKNKCPKNF
jgi:mevalonate kinase